MFVCCECRVLSGRSLCDELITRPEESYRLWCVVVCDLEASRMGAPYIHDISSLRVNPFYQTRNTGTKALPVNLNCPYVNPSFTSPKTVGTYRPVSCLNKYPASVLIHRSLALNWRRTTTAGLEKTAVRGFAIRTLYYVFLERSSNLEGGHGRWKNAYKIMAQKSEWKKLPGIRRCRRGDNIKLDIQK